MKLSRKFPLIGVGLWLLSISSCLPINSSQKTVVSAIKTQKNSPPTPPPQKIVIKEAELLAVGDIMMHSGQIKSGYNPQTKTYSYDQFFTPVKDILSRGDWVIGNLETTLAGADLGGYTGYPLFNAPPELLDALKNNGFNTLTTANNHSLDRGEKGVLRTLQNLRKRGLNSTGTFTSASESNKILIFRKNHIDMAILAYTYGTNGIPIPRGKNYLVNLIDEKKIIKDIQEARQEGADIVTVSLHFGQEYQRQPNPEQKKLVETLINQGADIILGSHPHVVQPYQIFQRKLGDKTRQAVAIYSLGNFISNQTKKYTDQGVIFSVKIRKTLPQNTTEIVKIETIPTWVHRDQASGKLNFRVLPLPEILTNKNDSRLSKKDYNLLEKYLPEMQKHLGSYPSVTLKHEKQP